MRELMPRRPAPCVSLIDNFELQARRLLAVHQEAEDVAMMRGWTAGRNDSSIGLAHALIIGATGGAALGACGDDSAGGGGGDATGQGATTVATVGGNGGDCPSPTTASATAAATAGQGGDGGAPAGTGGDGGAPVCTEDPEAAALRARIENGKRIFRFDTFGDEAFWGDQLRLHEAIAGEANGGVGDGVSPVAALGLGLKVDQDAIPADVAAAIQAGEVDLQDPATTLTLLQLNAVVGVTGFFDDDGAITSLGIQCALCHSTVDDAFAPGIGNRLDGWPNRDLDVGAIVATAPDLAPLEDLLGADRATVVSVLQSWGPGKYDAELIMDGKAFRPDGGSAATVLPAAFGLSGLNLHTYTGWGSVSHWNAYVAVTQMHGQGNFFDPRLDDAEKFPIAAANGFGHIVVEEDLVGPKLPDLQAYQLSLVAPSPPADRFDAVAAERGRDVFEGPARCASCHTPPLYTESGWPMHTPAEIGIDSFQADRSPDGRYRTTPLRGLFTREKGGFYHDGRFETLDDVVAHYEGVFSLDLSDAERADLVQFLRSL